MQNGDIVFPMRGSPPRPDELGPNYSPDPGNPFHFKLNFIPCQYRTINTVKLTCGRYVSTPYCSHKNETTAPSICKECTIEPKIKPSN